jgi:ParB family chromosome partitioning protein
MKKQTTSLSQKLNRDVFFGTSPDLPQILELDLDQLVPNPDQPRKSFSEESLRELASSIKRSGVIQPIVVKRTENPRMFVIVAGERRWRASKIAELTTIPAVLTTGDTEELSLIENIQREDLNALEEAEALSRMMEKHHYTQEQLGAIVGKAQNTVSQTLSLLGLPEKIRTEYHQSPTASKSMLMELSRMKDAKAQLRVWEQMRQGKIGTVRAAREKHPGSAEQKHRDKPKSALEAGKKFVQALQDMDQAQGHALDSEGYRELLGIRDRINALVEELSPTNSLLKQ